MSVYSGFQRLVSKDGRVRCSLSGWYYDLTDTNYDGKGGRIYKPYDTKIHDQSIEVSKMRGGKGWLRGGKLF